MQERESLDLLQFNREAVNRAANEREIEQKINKLSNLMDKELSELTSKPIRGEIISVPRINPKKPFSEFLCVQRLRLTACLVRKTNGYFTLHQEHTKLDFIQNKQQTIEFYIKIKFPTGYYGLVLSNEKMIVLNPVLLSGVIVTLEVKVISPDFYTYKDQELFKFVLLPLVNTEIKEVLDVQNL